MNEEAKYFIAQITEDLFRREPRNIGVLVFKGARAAARFVGENGFPGDIDRRKTKFMANPDVYSQWVTFWRKELQAPNGISRIMRANGGTYNIIEGGFVGDTDDDSAEQIANYLYSLLVSTEGLIEALGGDTEDSPEATAVKLKRLVQDEFANANILAVGPEDLWVPHPVRKEALVPGYSTQHTASYVQQTDELVIMEPVDFTTPRKVLAKDHAGWAAFMFSDVAAYHRGNGAAKRVNPIAIVQLKQADRDDPYVSYGMNMLRKHADIVNWLHDEEREPFLRARIEAAHRR